MNKNQSLIHPLSLCPHPLKIYPAALRRGDEGAEVARESFGVVVEKLAHAFEAGRADDESDVVRLVHAEDDLRVCVVGGVGPLLPRERVCDAAVVSPRLKTKEAIAQRVRDIEEIPLAPAILGGCSVQSFSE